MDIDSVLAAKDIKATEKRQLIADALLSGDLSFDDILSNADINDRGVGIILEAMEAITGKTPSAADRKWLKYAASRIDSVSNSVKREASRVVGNIAAVFPEDLSEAIEKLLVNTEDQGTVIRWGSAYALGRIVQLESYANSSLYDVVTELAEREQENGVKNQYLAGLKKADRIRRASQTK